MGIDATAMHDNEGYQPLVANYIEFYCLTVVNVQFYGLPPFLLVEPVFTIKVYVWFPDESFEELFK